MVAVGCSSSDQTAIDKPVNATITAQGAIDKAVNATIAAQGAIDKAVNATITADQPAAAAATATSEAAIDKVVSPTLIAAQPTITKSPTIEVIPTSIVELLPEQTEIVPATVIVSDPTEISIADLVKRARESVVRIDVLSTNGSVTGTGFAYSENLVLTNAHVVEGVDRAEVSLRISEGVQPQIFDATVLGRDENNDLAVLRVVGAKFRAMEFGSSSDAPVGTEVLAIGFPLGLDGDMSVTRGIVSRKIGSNGLDVIQHDAKILPGNSGGPLLTMDGKVIGINTAVVGDMSGTSGETLNFAIAIEEASKRLTSLEGGSNDIAKDRTFASSKYGHSFDIPDGWFLIEESDDSMWLYDEETQGFVFIQIDPDLSIFPNGQLWADYFYIVGATIFEDDFYELTDEQVTHNPDGSTEWYFIERFQRPSDDFISQGAESFKYDDGLGVRIYVEAPEDTFDAAFIGMEQILDSFQYPTISPPGSPRKIDRDCITIEEEYVGSITNTTIEVSAPASYFFIQTDCDVVGFFSIEGENLLGSGTFIGYLDGNSINFSVLGITNDASTDIEFSGTVSSTGIRGSYSVPQYEQKGHWEVDSTTPLVIAPTPRATSTPRPTVTSTPRPRATSTPIPEPIDPNQDSWFINGLLTHFPDDGIIETKSASVDVHDFIAQAKITNPYEGGRYGAEIWDYGFIFHKELSGDGLFDVIVVRSDGTWSHRSGTGPPYDIIDSGYLNNLNTDARDTNELTLIAEGSEAIFIVNGDRIATLKTGGSYRRGDVELVTGFFTGGEKSGAVTEYSDFRVQSLNLTTPEITPGLLVNEEGKFILDLVTCSADGIIETTFTNPIQSSTTSIWDYGFLMDRSGDYFDFVLIKSNGKWEVERRTGSVESGTTTASGSLPWGVLNTGNLAENKLRVTFVGLNGWLFVNDQFVGSFPLRTKKYGCHSIGAGYFSGGTEIGATTKYKNVSTWSAYEDPNQGRPLIVPTPLATPTISPTSTPQAIATPVSTEFDIDIQYDVGGVSGDSITQNRLPTFNIRVAANHPLIQPPSVKLVVDTDGSESYSFQQQLLTASNGPVWEYSYTFINMLPVDVNNPNDDVKWWVEVRAGNIGEVVEHVSDIFTLRIDQVIPQIMQANEKRATTLNSNGVMGTAIDVLWDGPLEMTSLSASDFRLKTDSAIYVPLEITRSDFGEDWIIIIFDRIIQDPGEWTVTIEEVVADLAGNSTFFGSKAVSR